MKEYKWHQVILIIVVSVLLNLCGKLITDYACLPIWLNSLGTVLTSYILGPTCGTMVGITNNILHGFLDGASYKYIPVNICIALIVGFFAKKGWMQTFLKTMTLSVILSLATTTISTFISLFFAGGKIDNIWGQGISDLLENMGMPYILHVGAGEFYVNFLDKVITLSLLFAIIKLHRFLRPLLPSPLKLQSINSLCISFAFILASALLPSMPLYAKGKDYNSYIRQIYNKENGLSGGKANDIASTNDGILWIGTYEGLYRHNGHEFRLMNEFNSTKTVRCLYVDDEGRLFVGSNDNGLSIVINETISNIIDEDSGLPDNSVRCVTRSSEGLYYVGTAEQLAVLSIVDGLSIKKIINEINGATKICADSDNHIVAVTVNGSLFLLKGSQILCSMEQADNGLINGFTSANFSPEGSLYAASEPNQLIEYKIVKDETTGEEKLIAQDTIFCGGLRHINSINFFEGVIFLTADNGTGYVEDGIFYNIENSSFNNSIDKMIEDYQGNLWFTSSRLGVLKMCESSFAEVYTSAGLDEVVVNSVSYFNGDLYFATDNGLTAIDGETNKALTNDLTDLLSNTRIRCLTTAKDGTLWICSKSHGVIYATPQGEIGALEEKHRFRVAKELSDGTIAAGGNDGIAFIRDKKVAYWLTQEDGFENPLVLTIDETPEGDILAGTDGGGMVIVKQYSANGTEQYKITALVTRADGLSSNVVMRTINDYDGTRATGGVFAVTSNGLCYLQKTEKSYHARLLSNFPFSNNYDMVITENKNIFILSSAGIFVVNRDELLSAQKLDYELLDLKKGLRGSLTANSWNYIDAEKNLYLSSDRGASRINLNTYDQREQSYRIQLKSIFIDSKRHTVQKDAPFIIPAESDRVEILPEIINYTINNPFISLYLEGVDERPNIMLLNDLSGIIYTHLKAGTYKFHIAVMDSKGRNIKEESVYTITKTSHIYDKWWFLLYAIGIMALVIIWLSWYAATVMQAKQIEKQKQEMEAIKKQVRMGNETIFAIANAVEARDKSTGRHSFRVAEYSVLIARELGFNEDELENLHKTGLLHDIGKIGVPDSILNKPGKLTDEEYAIMKTHVNIGGDILKDFSLIPHVDEGAKFHHERYDGKGYPNGLKGEEIPLNARIIGIADAFDAMTANRVYRGALDMNFVIEELKRCSGTQFDPNLVKIMLELIESGKLDAEKVYSKK